MNVWRQSILDTEREHGGRRILVCVGTGGASVPMQESKDGIWQDGMGKLSQELWLSNTRSTGRPIGTDWVAYWARQVVH